MDWGVGSGEWGVGKLSRLTPGGRTDKSTCSVHQGIIDQEGSWKPLSVGVEPLSLGVEPLSLGVEPLSVEVEPLSLEVEPLSLGVAPFSLEVAPFSLEVAPFSLEVAPFSLGVAPFSLEVAPLSLGVALLKDLITKICFSCSEKLLIPAFSAPSSPHSPLPTPHSLFLNPIS
ncbi:MAG: hypothetical protein V7L00_01440 [Nostoc sp.]|uniref:hypothetical protein n=1 Tax=Nostoc sp. TaxID=1180 RepID=UPI002FFACC6E